MRAHAHTISNDITILFVDDGNKREKATVEKSANENEEQKEARTSLQLLLV